MGMFGSRFGSAAAAVALASTLVVGCSGGKDHPDGSTDGMMTPDLPTSKYNLEVTQVATQASRVNVGEMVNVAFEVLNSGELDVDAFKVQVSLAKADGSGKVPLTSVQVPGLKAGKRYSSDPLMPVIPTDTRSGQYFITAEADPENLIQESDETDNLGKTLLPLQVVNPLIPDLIIVKPAMGPAVQLTQNSVINGSPVTATFTVQNVGMMPVLSFNVGLYLSTDTKVDKDTDMKLGTISVSALAGEEMKELSMTFTIPDGLALGNYYVLANADDSGTIEEGDEEDNVGVSDILTVRMPPDHFTDLIATDVHVKNDNPAGSKTTFFYGDRIDVDATFKNLGDVAADFFATRVFLSLDRNFDPPVDQSPDGGTPSGVTQDILLMTFNTQGLAGHMSVMQSKARDVENTIPTGQYYVILQVDSENTVDEADFEGNNILILDTPITISGNPPPPANDSCSAPQALSFNSSGVATVMQSTQYALDDSMGSCGGGGGNDLVYSFTTTAPKSLRVNVSGFSAVTYLRKGDCMGAMDMGLCADARDLYIKTLDPGTYYLFVDGEDATQFGDFTMTVTQGAPVAAAYTFSTVPAAMTDISTTGMLITPFADSQDSGCANNLAMGFSLPFFENMYTSVQVHADGYLRFGATDCAGFVSNQSLPDPTDPNNIIAAFWDDLGFSDFGSPHPNAKIFVQAMADKYIVQYSHWLLYGDDTSDLNFQVILHLNGNIEYQYGVMTSTNDPMAAQGSGATIGLENSDGSDGYQYSMASAVITGPMGILATKAN
jgi:hypothetical protein